MSLGEPNIKRALDWILDRLADDPGAKRSALIDEASRQFDLTPLEADFLYRQLTEATQGRRPAAEA
jgi:hypothetical protein